MCGWKLLGIFTFLIYVSAIPQSKYTRQLSSSEQERYQQRERQLRYEQFKQMQLKKEQQRYQSSNNDQRVREDDTATMISNYRINNANSIYKEQGQPIEKQSLRYKVPEMYAEEPQNKEPTWNLEVDLPGILNSVFGVPKTNLRSGLNADDQKFKIEVKTPNVHTILKTIEEMMRRNYDPTFSYVEEAPGALKSPPVEYPPNYMKNNLQKLFRIKERVNKKKKELNDGKEFD